MHPVPVMREMLPLLAEDGGLQGVGVKEHNKPDSGKGCRKDLGSAHRAC